MSAVVGVGRLDMEPQEISFMWLEITGKCQLRCGHCYAESGPDGSHGAMDEAAWRRVIDDGVGLGVRMVQFIGGEPTLHPNLPSLVRHALSRGLEVEVFSNLTHVSPGLWEIFAQPGVRLATSYYSDDSSEHESITFGRGSHARTRENIIEAIRRDIPIRVGIIDHHDGQRVAQARSELEKIGVTAIEIDRLRQVGRGLRGGKSDTSQLCGQCGDGKLAISASGDVWPCVFARWLPMGNALKEQVSAIVRGEQWRSVTSNLTAEFTAAGVCVPEMCNPQCGPSCSSACRPVGNCRPAGGCAPDYRR